MAELRIAVVCLTRDRLAYTQHCFQTLRDNAGCDYELHVLDNASSDDSPYWLEQEFAHDHIHTLCLSNENVGICRGANTLLDELDLDDYDVIVRFDNDCEVITPGTLAVCADLAATYGVIAAPRVLGLRSPLQTFRPVTAGDRIIDQASHLGGIFMAIPAFVFSRDGYRFDEQAPLYGGDEAICTWHRARGGVCGYVRGLEVNHYLTSDGQDADTPDYTARKHAEISG